MEYRPARRTPSTCLFREFLNHPEYDGGATVKAYINDRKKTYRLQVSDCGNHITLHGGYKLAKEKENAVHKLKTLIRACETLLEAIQADQAQPTVRKRATKTVTG
jgi:hypothetical protein